ncbi:MAG: penicillin-binding protein 1C [Proteobacteria bacterium]|nr:penicillin-binding protein 1C [Pseudomonadota bacterium]
MKDRILKRVLPAVILFFLLVWVLRLTIVRPILEKTSFSQIVTDNQGDLLRLTLARDDKYRIFTPLEEISPSMVEGTLLYEDEYFYWHFGVNPTALIRAAWISYAERRRPQGASTITMQLARKHFHTNSRSILGKSLQILQAIYLELFYSKHEILEAYLNITPYGFNIEGIGAASLIYLDKPPKRLKLIESISLSILPQSPSRRTKSLRNSPILGEEVMTFRKNLFDKWVRRHPQNIDSEVDFFLPMTFRRPWELPFLAPHVTMELLQKDHSSKVINSTLDSNLQSLVERMARIYIGRREMAGFKNAAVLLVDHQTMEVKASLGSVDFHNRPISGQVNGVKARRSPGSTLKPFVYGLALDQGTIHPQSILKDAPTGFGTYNPENFDKNFVGPISATEALVHSRNLPAIQLAAQLKEPSFHKFLYDLGIPLKEDPNYYGLSIVLGSAEVSMIELAQLYSAIVQQGIYRPVKWISTKNSLAPGKRIFSKEAAYLTLHMLSQNPPPQSGIGEDWVLDKKAVSWKTGTSFGFRDAWAIGIMDRYVLVVWIGNFSGVGNPIFVGRRAAGPLFFELIDAIIEQEKITANSFHHGPQLNINEVEVCSVSGEIPGPYCGTRKSTLFIPGKSPIHRCDVHRSVKIDIETGLRGCLQLDQPTRDEIYEFWPSHLLNLFKKAGLPRRTPPAFHPRCTQNINVGLPPKITSPKENVEYSIRIEGKNARSIPLVAIADADASKLMWFVDSKLIGKTFKDTPLFWNPKSGSYTVRVVDQLGRSDSKEIKVKLVK